MSFLNRWLRTLKMLPPALSVALPGLGPLMARRRWPRTRGTLQAPGLHEPVEILRDKWGVPHIFARNEHDLFFAQGYVHAQDRLWQMELSRRIGDGRLSEVLGPGGLAMDRFARTLGLRRLAERGWERVETEARTFLEAYAEGINARLAGREPLPVEFSLLGFTPTPWTGVDTLVRGNLLSLFLSGNYRLELLRARLLAEVGEALTAQLLPPHGPDTPLIVPPESMNIRGLRGTAALEGLDGVDGVLGDPNIVSGSNNWVVHGSRTASGKPLLANDVHIGLGLPSVWYENGLHGGRFDGVGFSLPGVPMLVLGHNGRIAWGMSNLGPDTQDFYLEKLDDARAPRRYEFKGEWHELELRREEISVRGAPPVVLEVRRTRHGPLMNEAMSRLLKDAEPMALRWGLEDSEPLVHALVGINLASDWKGFRAAVARWESPGQNFVYADGEGNIAYQATGKIPLRAAGHAGTVPMPGWTGE
ncbi:MAG TPA: penicillin acylase family protein, partial [Myxococcaceae bacterium]|nr:penicillin acylase family protein [Myxococcaceae bacterium]